MQIVGYVSTNLFQFKYAVSMSKQFYFKLFSLASVHSLIVKNIYILSYSV